VDGFPIVQFFVYQHGHVEGVVDSLLAGSVEVYEWSISNDFGKRDAGKICSLTKERKPR
jgi:hypothetical protein